jgi:hypothetical protein
MALSPIKKKFLEEKVWGKPEAKTGEENGGKEGGTTRQMGGADR